MAAIIEDHSSGMGGRLAFLVGIGAVVLATPVAGSPLIPPLVGLAAGLATYVGLRARAGRQRRLTRLSEGDAVQIKLTAAPELRPGEVGQVRSVRDDPNNAGKSLCQVEFRDGARVDVPEIFLERIVRV